MFTADQIYQFELEMRGKEGIPVIVEGQRDRRSLARLGFTHIIDISGKPLDEVVSLVKREGHKTAIILTDLDPEGERMTHLLASLCEAQGIRPDLSVRRRIADVFGVFQIEELGSSLKLMEDYYGKDCSIYDKISNRSRFFDSRSGRKARRDRGHIRSD
jgi:5S rRNA maturation endonuclease (ribonuclease M5)